MIGEHMPVVLLGPAIENSFLKFLRRDVISNFFAFLDLKYYRGKTKFWIAIEDAEILGYLLEHDKRILNLRGNVRCADELLNKASLIEADINVEPGHLQTVEKFYEPTRPIGISRGKITTLLAMEVNKKRFRPVIKHDSKKLSSDEFNEVEKLYTKFYDEMALGQVTRERIVETLSRCSTFGIYAGGELVSFASGSILEDVGHVAPVYTSLEFRGKGYATSACSALVRELLSQRDRTILYTPEDDIPAIRVYEKIGFAKTGHRFLAFWGRKIQSS